MERRKLNKNVNEVRIRGVNQRRGWGVIQRVYQILEAVTLTGLLIAH
jgi:hypothetical protein